MSERSYSDLVENPLEDDRALNLVHSSIGGVVEENAEKVFEARFRKRNSDGKITTRQTPRVHIYAPETGYGYLLHHEFSASPSSAGGRYVSLHKSYIAAVLREILDIEDGYYRVTICTDSFIRSELVDESFFRE